MAREPGQPNFSVIDEDKAVIIRGMVPEALAALNVYAGPEGVTADDIIDLFAIAIALVIENDSHLTAPSHVREAAESAKNHILRRVRTVGEGRLRGGPSALQKILDEAEQAQDPK